VLVVNILSIVAFLLVGRDGCYRRLNHESGLYKESCRSRMLLH